MTIPGLVMHQGKYTISSIVT